MIAAILTGFLFSILLVFAVRYFRGKLAVLATSVPGEVFFYFTGSKDPIVNIFFNFEPYSLSEKLLNNKIV